MKIELHKNHFYSLSGSSVLADRIVQLKLLLVGIMVASITSALGLVGLVICVALLLVLVYSYFQFKYPVLGIYFLMISSFFVIGLARYIRGPWGLTIDILLIVVYISLIFKEFRYKIPWEKAKSPIVTLISIWMLYIFLQLFNPEAPSKKAWLFAMRGLALYQWLLIPLIFILFDKQKNLKTFLIIWALLSLIGTLKGVYQFYFGVDSFEFRWLNEGGAQTHILFGKLRIFSFYSDAGQFGASQGHSAVVFGILFLHIKDNIKLRYLFLLASVAGIIGMVISGTRGALSVPAMGGVMYILLNKNIKMIVLGTLLGFGVYFFFVHTTIGQGNAEIRRMRTAFDPEEASFKVRRDNQKKLVSYLSSRPFGGGVGSAGNWGKRFTPNTFLANTPTDSWYVQIWAETGIVGLLLYLFMIFYVLYKGAHHVYYKLTDSTLRYQILALTCGMAGITVASYGNGVFGQMPTGTLMYISMAYIMISPTWETTKQKIKST